MKQLRTCLFLALLSAPSFAFAQSANELGLSELAGWIKSGATFLFIDAGPWLAVIGLGILLVAGFTGRMEWRTVFTGIIVVAVFFMIPSVVNRLRSNTESELNQLGHIAPASLHERTA